MRLLGGVAVTYFLATNLACIHMLAVQYSIVMLNVHRPEATLDRLSSRKELTGKITGGRIDRSPLRRADPFKSKGKPWHGVCRWTDAIIMHRVMDSPPRGAVDSLSELGADRDEGVVRKHAAGTASGKRRGSPIKKGGYAARSRRNPTLLRISPSSVSLRRSQLRPSSAHAKQRTNAVVVKESPRGQDAASSQPSTRAVSVSQFHNRPQTAPASGRRPSVIPKMSGKPLVSWSGVRNGGWL